MKSNLTIIALAAMLSTGVVASAQDYDDIYYDASKEAKVEKPRVVVTESYDYSNGYSNTDVTTYQYDNSYVAAEIVNGRDVDEYNRRGSYDEYYVTESDTTTTTTTTVTTTTTTTAPDYTYTTRIRRFDNPVIVIETNTDPLVNGLALITAAAVVPAVTWAWLSDPWDWGWYGWYTPYYSPWRYSAWYGPGPGYYGWGWGWSWGWSRPWCGGYYYGGYYGGWHGGWYGHHYYHGPRHGGWGDPGRHTTRYGGYSGGRRPNNHVGGGSRPIDGGHGGHGGQLTGNRGANRPGMVSGAGRNNIGRDAVSNHGGSVRPGQSRPSGSVGSNGGAVGRRPGVSSTPSSGSRPSGSVGSGRQSSRGSVSRPSQGSSPSRSSGYSGGGRSGGYSGGGRSGGFSGGGRSGGFSGGGRSGGFGGGGRSGGFGGGGGGGRRR